MAGTGGCVLPVLRGVTGRCMLARLHSARVLAFWPDRVSGMWVCHINSRWTVSALNCHLFLSCNEQQPGPVPESQAARLPVLLICSPCPHPPPPTCPFLSLACQVPEKTCDKALANSVKLDQNTVKASPVAAKSAQVLPVVSVDHARPAWQRPHGC